MLKLVLVLIVFSVLLLMPIGSQNAFAVTFPASCFADVVITFDPKFSGDPPTRPIFLDPLKSLGPNDFDASSVNPGLAAVTLGQGGLLEVGFVDNVLTNSGDASLDLHIFEDGLDAEHTFVAIRPTAATALVLLPAIHDANLDGFYEVGFTLGGTGSIDIDSFFPAAPANTYVFDAVQLLDDVAMVVSDTIFSRGADIDAVCGIESREVISTSQSGNLPYRDPNLGDVKHGQGHDNGFCMNLNCINVNGLFNHFSETTIPQGSTQTFTVLVNCPRGANTCNHISLAGALPDADFYDDRWSATVDRQVGSDNWDLTVYNPFGEIGEVTVTVQSVDESFVTASFNIQFLIPGSIGTPDGIGDPQENNRHIHVTVWDSNRGASNYIFNEGIYVDDIYAYPQVETSYETPLEVEPLCLNENSNKRYTCAFDKVRDWTIKNAEKALSELG